MPGATWSKQGTQNFSRNIIQLCSVLETTQETQHHVAQSQLSARSRSTRAGTVAPRDHRRNLTRRRPPCLPAGDQQFCAPQSRQAGVEALRRALWRLRRLGTYRASYALGAGKACTHGLKRFQRICARLAGWRGSHRLEFARRRPGMKVASMVQTLSRRTNARNPASHAGDGQVGRVSPRPSAGRAWCSRTPACKPYQPSHFQPGHQQREHQPAPRQWCAP